LVASLLCAGILTPLEIFNSGVMTTNGSNSNNDISVPLVLGVVAITALFLQQNMTLDEKRGDNDEEEDEELPFSADEKKLMQLWDEQLLRDVLDEDNDSSF